MVTWGGYGTMAAKEGRHFCINCRKLIRVGQRYEWKASPTPFKRETRYSYWHSGQCPEPVKK